MNEFRPAAPPTCKSNNPRIIAAILPALLWGSTATAGTFTEPPVFASSHGLLDLLMVAKPAPAPGVAFEPRGGGPILHPTGWVYEICPRTAANSANQCPPGPLTASEYGGVRLAMQKGDALKIRLVNRLPKLDPIKVDRSVFPGGLNLPLNPTNWHTDGLDAPAREPTLADRSFGGNVAVEIYNSANGAPAQ